MMGLGQPRLANVPVDLNPFAVVPMIVEAVVRGDLVKPRVVDLVASVELGPCEQGGQLATPHDLARQVGGLDLARSLQ